MPKRQQPLPRKPDPKLLARLKKPSAPATPEKHPAVQDLAAVAGGLFASGHLSAAFDAYRRLVKHDRSNRLAHLTMAAILGHDGQLENGMGLMRGYFEEFPLDSGRAAPERPLVLRMRGFHKTRPIVFKSSGGFRPRLRGGHFTTQFLLLQPDFALRTYTIANDNIMRVGIPIEHDLIINTIAEPDIEGRSLEAFTKHLEANPSAPVINNPHNVWHTARDRNYERLKDTDRLTFPETRRISFEKAEAPEVLRRVAELGVDLPFIIREAGTQTGRTTQLVTNVFELETYAKDGLDGDYFVITYRQILWNRKYFRKLRLFQIDGEFYPVVCHIDQVWNVHGGNRKEIMRTDEALMAEEKAFLSDWRSYVGPGNAEHLYWLAEVTGLDFFGIDFTIDNEGKIFIYELNPAMRHSFDHAKNFPYKMEHDLNTSEAFMRMVRSRLPADWAGHKRPAPKAVAPV